DRFAASVTERKVKRRRRWIHRQAKARGLGYPAPRASHREGISPGGRGRRGGETQPRGTRGRTRRGGEDRAGARGQPGGGEGHGLGRARDQCGTDSVGDRGALSDRFAAPIRQREVKSARPQIFLNGEVVLRGPTAVQELG